MATPSKVKLDTSLRPVFAVKELKQEAADTVSELLQGNHEKHHIFFNQDGFHNHIAHHLLTLYALGATPSQIHKQYDLNASYQRPPVNLEQKVVEDMHDPERFKEYLGDEKYYHDFLLYFQGEMEAKGWESVLDEYVFGGGERADDMLVRMFAGFLHPIIHLGFGLEFRQPAIMAEALAQAAVHTNWMGKLLLGAERAAQSTPKPAKSLVQLLDELRKNEKVVNSPKESDGNKLRDGVIGRALDEMVALAAAYVIREEEMEERMAEMVDFDAYFTTTAQRPPKLHKFDFFYIHCLNASIFFPAFLSPTSPLNSPQKRRLLEWKARNDLAMYASRGSPTLLLNEVADYVPKARRDGRGESWDAVFERVCSHDDDGHAAKVVRSLAHGEQICGGYAGSGVSGDWKIKHEHWILAGNMAIDSVEGHDDTPDWVRSCGFASAWEKVGERGAGEQGAGKRKEGMNGDREKDGFGKGGYEDHGHGEVEKAKY